LVAVADLFKPLLHFFVLLIEDDGDSCFIEERIETMLEDGLFPGGIAVTSFVSDFRLRRMQIIIPFRLTKI
jgi:hypothetical protein